MKTKLVHNLYSYILTMWMYRKWTSIISINYFLPVRNWPCKCFLIGVNNKFLQTCDANNLDAEHCETQDLWAVNQKRWAIETYKVAKRNTSLIRQCFWAFAEIINKTNPIFMIDKGEKRILKAASFNTFEMNRFLWCQMKMWAQFTCLKKYDQFFKNPELKNDLGSWQD